MSSRLHLSSLAMRASRKNTKLFPKYIETEHNCKNMMHAPVIQGDENEGDMADGNEVLRRLDQLESRALIGELVSSYCIACDDHDMPRLRSLFVPEIKIRSRDGMMNAEGLAEVMTMFHNLFVVRGPAFHWTHDRFVYFDPGDPDRATGLVLAHAETTPNGQTCLAAIRYNDVYRRIGGSWMFAERLLSFLYYMPISDYIEGMRDTHRMRLQGARMPADYPESLPSWQDFAKQ